MIPNHYEVLGARPDADRATLRSAYLAVMRETHPDRHPGDRAAAERARAANVAWHVLRDPGRRNAYDRARRAASPAPTPMPYVTTLPAVRQAHAQRFRHAFHLATLKAGGLIMLAGLVLLLLTAAR